jgi:hypothetical protein
LPPPVLPALPPLAEAAPALAPVDPVSAEPGPAAAPEALEPLPLLSLGGRPGVLRRTSELARPVFALPLVPACDFTDDGLCWRTQSLFARPVSFAHSAGISLCIAEFPGIADVPVCEVVVLLEVCAAAVAAIAIDTAAASNSSFHVFIVHSCSLKLATFGSA